MSGLISEDELMDLVDSNDRVIGQISRERAYSYGIHNIRVVNAFLRNSKGQLWIPVRSKNKRLFPGGLDFSVGGHVTAGEDYEDALIRETQEELGIDLGSTPFKQTGYFKAKESGLNSFMKIYEIEYEAVPKFNRDDFSGYSWLRPAEILKKIESGSKSKDDLKIVIKLLYPHAN
jgi:isopentenyl-diphosphate delta-isomerase